MDLSFLANAVAWVQAHGELILAVLGAFSAIARVTPTEADNKLVDMVLQGVHFLGLTKPQDPPAPPAA